jgi:sulfate/thiosulfate transport system substrate-binding protein
MRIRTRAALALLVVGGLALGACGDDDDDEAGSATAAAATSEAAATTAAPDAETTAATDQSGTSAGVPSGGQGEESDTISIVGFAVPEAANTAIAEAWNATADGEEISFQTSYGASGDQSRAVVEGLEADYVHFSVASDVTRLVDAGLVAEDWDDGPNKGVVSSSIVVFGVRAGNPKNIQTWDDLVQPGVEIVTPNPGSSGAARWNALAAYGQVIESGGTEEDAAAYLDQFFANVVALPSSGRDATTAFLGGTGDVFMTYENEAILARQNGEDFEYVIPETTVLIENPGAVLIEANPKANEWLGFVLSVDGQREFGRKGFRPTVEVTDLGEVEGALDPADPFPEVTNLLTVADDFGSWSELSTKFFDEEDGIVTQAIAKSGKGE